MVTARVTISKKVKHVKTFEVEANSCHELYQTAVHEAGLYLSEGYDDFDDFNLENIEIISEDKYEKEQ